MKPVLDETHDPKVQSWIESANVAGSDFPVQNLPFGVFRRRDAGAEAGVGIAIGDRIVDVAGMRSEGLFAEEGLRFAANACAFDSLNSLMTLGAGPRRALRRRLHAILRQEAPASDRQAAARHLVAQSDADMLLPAIVGDYTDFYASIFHATNVGKLFRPDNPLLPNYKYIPIGYHGRASSLVPSGTPVRRPSGQTRRARTSSSASDGIRWPASKPEGSEKTPSTYASCAPSRTIPLRALPPKPCANFAASRSRSCSRTR